ncbi:MAG: gliding motility lipoprotein GldH [Flavobacteriales bacterium]|nr:gliding motility lipoprotein GldH [Flavobacteriales bacterium]
MITTKNSVGRRKTEVGSWKQSVFGIPTLIFLLALLLFSCDSNKVFDQYIEVENGDWKRENVAKFTVNISDTTSAHNLYINVRNKGNYPFSNLYMFVKIEGPDGNFSIDTVNCTLADKSGKWLGKGIGDLWDVKVPYIGGFKFAHSGEYQFSFEQAMRVENGLQGISDIGLRIERKDD